VAGTLRRVQEEIVGFLNDSRATALRQDRILAAVLYTDLVASTALIAEVGDAQWRHLLDTHDRVSARIIGEHRGSSSRARVTEFLRRSTHPAAPSTAHMPRGWNFRRSAFRSAQVFT